MPPAGDSPAQTSLYLRAGARGLGDFRRRFLAGSEALLGRWRRASFRTALALWRIQFPVLLAALHRGLRRAGHRCRCMADRSRGAVVGIRIGRARGRIDRLRKLAARSSCRATALLALAATTLRAACLAAARTAASRSIAGCSAGLVAIATVSGGFASCHRCDHGHT